jgi:ABC-2 type transport system ATP-binding protein
VFLNRGRIVLNASMETLEGRFAQLMVQPELLAAARALKPLQERQIFGRTLLLYDGVPREQLAALGEVRTAGLADLFISLMGGAEQAQGVAA